MRYHHLLLSTLCSSLLIAGGDIDSEVPVIQTPTENSINDWSYQLEPYIFASQISGTTQIGRLPKLDIDVDFGTIVENLDFAAMLHFEALHKNGWGIWLDYGFMNLSSDITGPFAGKNDAEIHQGILEAFAMYRQPLSNGYIDYLAGISWWKNDLGNSNNSFPINIEANQNWVDPIIGARWSAPINNQWLFSLQGTIGGFGVGSQMSGTASVGVKYAINDSLDFDLQYKSIWVDYETGTPGENGYFAYDVATYGPIIGLNFKF